MCTDCIESYGGFDVQVTPDMDTTATMIRDLYDLPGCAAGGPLHIVTDDFNLERDSLKFCAAFIRDETGEYTITHEVGRLASLILGRLALMSKAERAATIGRAHGYL